jgi:hypothetical protein
MASYAFSYGNRAMPVSITMNPGTEFRVLLADSTRAPAAFIGMSFVFLVSSLCG